MDPTYINTVVTVIGIFVGLPAIVKLVRSKDRSVHKCLLAASLGCAITLVGLTCLYVEHAAKRDPVGESTTPGNWLRQPSDLFDKPNGQLIAGLSNSRLNQLVINQESQKWVQVSVDGWVWRESLEIKGEEAYVTEVVENLRHLPNGFIIGVMLRDSKGHILGYNEPGQKGISWTTKEEGSWVHLNLTGWLLKQNTTAHSLQEQRARAPALVSLSFGRMFLFRSLLSTDYEFFVFRWGAKELSGSLTFTPLTIYFGLLFLTLPVLIFLGIVWLLCRTVSVFERSYQRFVSRFRASATSKAYPTFMMLRGFLYTVTMYMCTIWALAFIIGFVSLVGADPVNVWWILSGAYILMPFTLFFVLNLSANPSRFSSNITHDREIEPEGSEKIDSSEKVATPEKE